MEKSGVKEWFDELKTGLLGDMPSVTMPLLLRIAECAARLAAAFVLANAQVFGAWHPFALGLVAASGTGLEGFFALIGACGGFLVFSGLADGVRPLSVALLIAAVGFVLKDLSFARRRWFAPLAAGVLTGIIGFVFLLDAGLTLRGIFMFIGEALAAAGCTYLCRAALEDNSGMARRIGLLALAAGFIAALTPISVFGSMSVGRLLASFIVLGAAQAGGWSVGAAMGVAAGVSVDAAGSAAPFFTLAYGLSGLVGGLLKSGKKARCALGYLVTVGICLVWMAGQAPTAALFETFAVCVVFMLLPAELLPRLRAEEGDEGANTARLVIRRLTDTANVFTELFESVSAALGRETTGSVSMSAVFDRTAERVCKKCMMNAICWERDCEDTFTALNDASVRFSERGEAEAGDFPLWFASRCRYMPRFVSVLNEELTALSYRRRYERRASEDRRLVAAQYGELSRILKRVAEKAADQPGYEPRLRRKLDRYLKTAEVPSEACVYRDGFGRLNVELDGLNREEALKLHVGISTLLAARMEEPRQVAGGVIFTEKERFVPRVGIASKCRREEMKNGDYGAWFKGGDGMLYLILSDGRGTGEKAEQESRSAVRVLEKLLRAGASPESAVKTLDSAYTLRGGGGGYATVDLFSVDLFTGKTEVIKWGAAPSYIRSGGEVRRLGQPGPPPGTGGIYEKSEITLAEGDFVVMCSDGLADREDDGWLVNVLGEYEGGSPRELAARLAAVAEQTRGLEDDMTVMAFCLEEE